MSAKPATNPTVETRVVAKPFCRYTSRRRVVEVNILTTRFDVSQNGT